jgi:hypothetical protein
MREENLTQGIKYLSSVHDSSNLLYMGSL